MHGLLNPQPKPESRPQGIDGPIVPWVAVEVVVSTVLTREYPEGDDWTIEGGVLTVWDKTGSVSIATYATGQWISVHRKQEKAN
jgi:hypothetical protein